MGWRSALVAGGLGGLFAVAVTAVYLWSIEIDDGLEALIVFPLLGLAMAAVGALGSTRRAGSVWVVQASAGSILPLVAVLVWTVVAAAGEDTTGSDFEGTVWLLVAVSAVSAGGSLFGLACLAGLLGWGAVEVVRWLSVRRRRPGAGHG